MRPKGKGAALKRPCRIDAAALIIKNTFSGRMNNQAVMTPAHLKIFFAEFLPRYPKMAGDFLLFTVPQPDIPPGRAGAAVPALLTRKT